MKVFAASGLLGVGAGVLSIDPTDKVMIPTSPHRPPALALISSIGVGALPAPRLWELLLYRACTFAGFESLGGHLHWHALSGLGSERRDGA